LQLFAYYLLKILYSLFLLNFQVSKKLSKKSKIAKNNSKRTAIISHQNFFNHRKKIESIGPDHYSIVLSHRTAQNVFDAIAIPALSKLLEIHTFYALSSMIETRFYPDSKPKKPQKDY